MVGATKSAALKMEGLEMLQYYSTQGLCVLVWSSSHVWEHPQKVKLHSIQTADQQEENCVHGRIGKEGEGGGGSSAVSKRNYKQQAKTKGMKR